MIRRCDTALERLPASISPPPRVTTTFGGFFIGEARRCAYDHRRERNNSMATAHDEVRVKIEPAGTFLCGTAEVVDGDVRPYREPIQAALDRALRTDRVKRLSPDVFIYHLREPLVAGRFPTRYSLEIGFRVPEGTRVSQGLVVRTLSVMRCACLTHRGPISTIGEAYHALHRGLTARGLHATGRQERDVYLAEDVAELQTEIA